MNISRRQVLQMSTALIPLMSAISASAQERPRLLLVHGRAQGGRTKDELLAEWTTALTIGAEAAGHDLPSELEILLPFYGDRLDEIVDEFEIPLTSEITTKGDTFQDEFLTFQEEVVSQLRFSAGITDGQLVEVYGDNPRERGPQNWEWVQAIIKAIDRFSPSISEEFLEHFLRDVFIYIQSPGARSLIDQIVTENLNGRPTIMVAHSLGSVVIYNVLRNRPDLNVPLLVTVGSPLGINAIKRRFRPLRHPNTVVNRINAFDERDVVALNALDATNFPVTPAVQNISSIGTKLIIAMASRGIWINQKLAGRLPFPC